MLIQQYQRVVQQRIVILPPVATPIPQVAITRNICRAGRRVGSIGPSNTAAKHESLIPVDGGCIVMGIVITATTVVIPTGIIDIRAVVGKGRVYLTPKYLMDGVVDMELRPLYILLNLCL